jgi:hypothetical protein
MVEALAPLVHYRFLQLPDGTRLIGSTQFDQLVKRTSLSEATLNEKLWKIYFKTIKLTNTVFFLIVPHGE